MKSRQKIFFTLFPSWYWIIIFVGILFHFIEEVAQLGNVLINLGTLLIAFKGAVIVHEAGHLIAARAVGATPRRMVLGKGHELFRTKFFNVTVVVNSSFLGGHAYASFGPREFLKLRYGVFILGGVALNVIVAFFVGISFQMEFNDQTGEIVIAVPYAIFLANAIMITNLIPYYTTVMGMKVPTDGLALLQLPFSDLGEIERRIDMNLLWEGHEFLESKDYQSAWNAFSNYLEKYPDTKIIAINLSLILLKTGKIEESLKECSKLLDHINDNQVKKYAGLIYNQIAWIYLVLNDIEQADHFSVLAIKAIPNENIIRGTRGSVLIEKGAITEGMGQLFHSMDFHFINNATLSSAIYLMFAYHLKGNVTESLKYSQFVEQNQDRLEPDERVLYRRNLDKMQLHSSLPNSETGSGLSSGPGQA